MPANFGNRLVAQVRKRLAEASVKFIKDLAMNSLDEKAITLVSDQNISFHNKLPCLPYFRSTTLIRNQAIEEKIPIVICTKQISKENQEEIRDVFYFYKSDGKEYSVSPIAMEDSLYR